MKHGFEDGEDGENHHLGNDTKKLKHDSNGSGKQTLINHYFGEIPGLEDLGTAMIKNSHGTVNFVETVRRLCKYESIP
jgi:hypothetical protein